MFKLKYILLEVSLIISISIGISSSQFEIEAQIGSTPHSFNKNISNDTETVQIDVMLNKGKSNIIVDNKKDYTVIDFEITFSNNSEICQSDNCKYVFNNGKFTPSMLGTGYYLLTGRLIVSEPVYDATKSEFYDLFADLGLVEKETTGNKTTKLYEGSLDLNTDQFQYDITNATLFLNDGKNPTLTLQGERELSD